MRGSAVIVLLVLLAGFVGWWFSRSERCLAREPHGYWAFAGPEIDPQSYCFRMDSLMIPL